MKKVIMEVIGIAIALALVVAVVASIAERTKSSGTTTINSYNGAHTEVTSLASPIPSN